MADVQSNAIEKSRLLQEKPTAITETRDPDEILMALEAISPDLVIREPTDAEVVEDAEPGPELPR